jgi:hypothetical protein
MKAYIVVPLAVAALCAIWTWLENRKTRVYGAMIPDGLRLTGQMDRPDLDYDGSLVLGGTHRFETLRCRRLHIAPGADIHASVVEAGRVIVEGALRGVRSLIVGRNLRVTREGTLRVDDILSPVIHLDKCSSTIALTVTGPTRLYRHPHADVKGFFATREEAVRAGIPEQVPPAPPDQTEVLSVRSPAQSSPNATRIPARSTSRPRRTESFMAAASTVMSPAEIAPASKASFPPS